MFVVFYAFMYFMGPKQGAQAPTPPKDLYQTLLRQNAARMDVTIAHQTYPQYQTAIDEDVKAKKLTEAEGESKKIAAAVTVADTQLKAGLHGHDTGRIRDALYTLSNYERHLAGKPEWNAKVPVTDVTKDDPATPNFDESKEFGWKEWSGQELYSKISSVLMERNQQEPVWGFVPGYQIIDGLVALTGRVPGFSYAFAAFLLALLVRSIVYPLSQKQIMYGRQMSQLMPLVKEIKDRYEGDQLTQNQKVMELYKEYGVNPMAGCGPALLQMPLFFMIYQCMVHYQFTFEKGTFLWINPATSQATNGFVAANLGQMDAILTIIYGITMLSSTLLTPVSDPTQVRQQRVMGVGMSVMMTFFMFTGAIPVVSAFVLYWTFTNLLATIQSLRAYRLPLPPLVKVNTKDGGVFPTGGGGGKWAKFFEEAQRQAQEQQQKKNGTDGDGDKPKNGKPSKDSGVTFLGTGETKTGTPAKHKPKKRK